MQFLAVHVVLSLLASASCDELLRPIAIIPWSQYQMRMRQMQQLSEPYYSEVPDKWPMQRQSSGTSTRWLVSEKSSSRPTRLEKWVTTKEIRRQKPAIRAQLRQHMPLFERRENWSDAPNVDRLGFQQYIKKKEMKKMRPYQPAHPLTETVTRSQYQSLQAVKIPNGVPLHAGTWEGDQPHYEVPRRPQQLAAATLGSATPLTPLSQSQLGASPLNLGGAEGNIVDAIFGQGKANAVNAENAPIQAVQQAVKTAAGVGAQNPFENLLNSGAPLDQITKLANNLLNIGGGEGAKGGGLLETMTNALRGARLPLPNTSFQDDGKAKPQQTIMEQLITQAASVINQSIKEHDDKEKQFRITKEREDSLKLLDKLPQEDGKLLKAAITSGDLDADSLASAIKSLVKDDTKEDSKKEKESRLLDWIRENRPTSKSTEVMFTATDKLPYYGKYCGSLAEQLTAKRKFKPSGAVWVVDNKRFIISKFYFQPGSLLSENVTFWLGPLKETDSVLADMFPSENGFYVKPQPIDISVFALDKLPPIEAKVRSNPDITSILLDGLKPIEPIVDKAIKLDEALRSRRSVLSLSEQVEAMETDKSRKKVQLMVQGGTVQLNGTGSRSESLPDDSFLWSSSESPTSTITTEPFRLQQPEDDRINESYAQPLEWYAGFQPILLTLPDGTPTKAVHWISLWDHKRHEPVASLLLPNGPAFRIPGVVTLRGFSPNGGFNISSGEIKVIDVKTIEITNFVLQTEGKAVWFVIGKDILPNISGNIVPLYDSHMKLFDCESLRDYNKETVNLRLPGSLDIKDVFWFSVFSMVDAVSYSHIYLPFNDMQLPPDLNGVPTPSCKYSP